MRTRTITMLLLLAAGVAGPAQAQTVLYVDSDSPIDGPGNNWEHAYHYLQNALGAAESGCEIRVAEGVHRPDESTANPAGTGDRETSFQMKNGVTIKGGYAGYGVPDPDERDIVTYETILSGDVDENDGPGPFDNNDGNSHHVFYHPVELGLDHTAILDGFTIGGGNADGSEPHDRGGGMYNLAGNPTVTDCTFSENSATYGGAMRNEQSSPTVTGCTFIGNASSEWGGAICNYNSSPSLAKCAFSGNSGTWGGGMDNEASNPTLTDCTFSDNLATNGGGGGMDNWASSSPTIINCTFSENSATGVEVWAAGGGGMYNELASNPILTNCTFTGNSASLWGGGIHNEASSPTLINCTFTGNSASLWGGGMANCDSAPSLTGCTFTENSGTWGGGMDNEASNPTLTDCTFSDNLATNGGGGGMDNWASSSPTIINCTFSDNSATGVDEGGGGGGMHNESGSSPILTNCTFTANSTNQWGGGMHNEASSPTLINCTFTGNSALASGGGMHNESTSSPTLTNCTFAENSAVSGRAVACDSLGQEHPSTVEMTNSILWDGGDGIWNNDGSTIVVTFSNVQGGWTNDDCPAKHPNCNIDADPLFVPGPLGCYYLSQTSAGQAVDGPCIDAGSDTAENLELDEMTTRTDEAGDTGIVDLGYHYPVSGLPLIMGDYDRNAEVNLADFAAMQTCFTNDGPTEVSPCCRIFDFEPDADVDLDDYTAFLIAFDP